MKKAKHNLCKFGQILKNKKKLIVRKLKIGKVVIDPRVILLSKVFLLLLVAVSILFNFKSLFVAAVVNGRPITRFSLDRQLEKQSGKQILDNQITQILISQEGKKQNVNVTPEEINQKIEGIKEELKKQNADLDNLLQTQGTSQKELKEQIKLQLIIEKILGKDISVSEQEIGDYYEKNKSYFPKDSTLESLKKDLEKDLLSQKIGEKLQPWLDELKKKAKIYYFLKL